MTHDAVPTPRTCASYPATSLTGAVLLGLVWLAATGCDVRRMAINNLADALAESGAAFASDDDPELIRDAAPFSLKLIESLLEETPEHRGLLLAACRGFTQYSYAFVHQEADQLEREDLDAALQRYDRARKLYVRARDYGLRGLDVAHPGFSSRLRVDPRAAVATANKADVPLLYWTAAAWGSAIAISKHDPNLIADQRIVEALIDRALDLDESFDDGAVHAFLVSYEDVRQGASEPAAARIRRHFDKAVALSRGQSAAPFVAMAEGLCVQEQNRAEFESLLARALEVDPDERREWRLANIIMQQRARWLLSIKAELFLE